MKSSLRLFLLGLSRFSLDAPLVAIAWQDLIAHQAGVLLTWSERMLLFLSTWLVYAGDRMADARTIPRNLAPLPRHQFASQYFYRILVVWGIVLSATALLAWRTVSGEQMFWAGGMVALLGLYFLFCFSGPAMARVIVPREIIVSLVMVSAATFFPAFRAESISILLLCALWIIGLDNALGISCWEREVDRQLGNQTVATRFPHIHRWYGLLLILSAGACLMLLVQQKVPLTGCLLTVIGLWILDRSSVALSYRAPLADLLLLLPWLIVQVGKYAS